ncbi:WYL domain-containing protein [Streptomyces sp. NPDC059650]|uniref:WYL domain-containing protein n=1 Tax=Streptomyces sp. NPDC059650 TaxID=3346896 RepID=UPI00368B450F
MAFDSTARYGPTATAVTATAAAAAGSAARRRAEPCHLVASDGLWYLLAHDTDRDDWRLFRLDRSTEATPVPGSQTLAGLDAEDDLDADPDVLVHLRAAADRLRRAAG